MILACVLFPEIVVAYSASHAFPDNSIMAIMLAVIVVFCSFLIEAKTDEPDDLLRQVGVSLIIGLGFFGVSGVILHAQISRDVSNSRSAAITYKTDHDKWEKSVQAARDKNSTRRTQEDSASADLLAKWQAAAAQARKNGVPPPPFPRSAPTTEEEPKDALVNQQEPVRPLTEAEVKASWASWNFGQQGLILLIAVLGLTIVAAIRKWDKDDDGLPDWIQRIANRMPEDKFARQYPRYYRDFYPDGTRIDKPNEQSSIQSPSLSESPRIIGFSGPQKGTLEIASEMPPKLPLAEAKKGTLKNDPHAGQKKGTLAEAKKGTFENASKATILGVVLPILPGTRWKTNRGRGVAECWVDPPPENASGYLGGLGKKKIFEFRELDQQSRFSAVESIVSEWKEDWKKNQGQQS